MKKLCAYLLFFVSHYSFAQSTDVVKLYVLYDISGSTRVEDIHQNLKELASVLIRNEKGTSKSPFSIEFIAFGENAEIKSLNLYEDNGIAKSRIDLINYLNRINDRTDNNRIQRYTHLKAALDAVSSKANPIESYGVFIFADGLLRTGDVEDGDAARYCDGIKNSIKVLHLNRKPVFLIQSSTSLVNDYYDIPKSIPGKSDSIVVTNDFFWLRSKINYGEEKQKSITQIFEKFLLQAFFRIQNSDRNDRSDDVIGKFLTLAELLQFYDLGEKIKYFKKTDSFDSLFDASFKEPITIKHKADIKVIEKKRPKYAEKTTKENIGGPKQINSFANFQKDLNFLVPADMVTFSSLLTRIGTKLESIRSMSSDQLDSLQHEIQAIINFDGFLRVGPILDRYKQDHRQELVLIAQNAKTDLLDLSGVSTSLQLPDFSLPVDNKSRNVQEAVILGLTDYLIKRTKQEAVFLSLEYINKNVFEPSSFLRDTLFYHTAKLFGTLDPKNDSHFEPNLVLIKESFNQDMDLMSTSLIKHPKVRTSNGLVALLYSAELINNLSRGNTIEESFKKVKEKLSINGSSSGPLERGLLFTSYLIYFLEQHDLSLLYQQNSPETLSSFSKIIAIYIAEQFKEIHEINNIDAIAEKIKMIYFQYENVKAQLEQYKNEINSLKPTGSFAEYQQYKRQLTFQILKACGELLLTGVDISEHYTNINSGELKQDVNSLRTVCNTALECWFLIQDKKYAEAASHLIPMIPKLPIVKIETTDDFKDKFGKLRSSVNLIALKNDESNISIVLRNSLVDFTGTMYVTTSKQEAMNFLARNQLSFLTPLLLHVRDSIFNSSTSRIPIWEIRLPDNLSINDVVKIYKDAVEEFSNNSFKVSNLLDKINKKAIESTWSDSAKVHVAKQLLSYFSIDGLDENLKKLLAVAGEISTARTANEVENVIGKYALPVASYRIKRNTLHTWMINAYVGGSGVLYQDKSHLGYSIAAPVGIEHSWRSKGHKTSFSLFASVLDVGNIINYRINESQTSDRTILLENVVSPGFFSVLGLSKRFPLSAGVGYQFNPQRASVFIAFDLPLIRIR